jgi:hypothetical protein
MMEMLPEVLTSLEGCVQVLLTLEQVGRSIGSAIEGTSEDSMDLLTHLHSSVLVALTIEQRSIDAAILPRSSVQVPLTHLE